MSEKRIKKGAYVILLTLVALKLIVDLVYKPENPEQSGDSASGSANSITSPVRPAAVDAALKISPEKRTSDEWIEVVKCLPSNLDKIPTTDRAVRRDCMQILGVNPGDNVKRSYRKLAKLYHPDKNKSSEATDIFKVIGAAHEFLTK